MTPTGDQYDAAVTLVMGVLNVTPDSFSDGGRWFDHDRAIVHGRELAGAGADIVDVGGESTRPGAHPVAEDEELRRVLPVVASLSPTVRVSVDTRKRRVAEAALAAGATMVNDVSASLWEVAADAGAAWIAMHSPADPRTMAQHARYVDVVAEVRAHLLDRAERAADAGVPQVWIDPGIGFGKTPAHNLSLLRHLDALVATGWGVVVGTSRKSFLGALSAGRGADPAPVGDRVEASVATSTWAIVQGAAAVRVHDVAPVAAAARLARPPAATTATLAPVVTTPAPR